MKNTKKIFFAAVFLCLTLAVLVHAEEAKTEKNVPAVSQDKVAVAQVVPVRNTTLDNLQEAFNGEKNANARYLAFAKKADEEGYGKAASLFRAAARAEQIHFERHAALIEKMGGIPATRLEAPVVKRTMENLQAAFDGETYESTRMYPKFVKKAKADKNEDAMDSFEDAEKAEAVHAGLYKKAMDNLKAWKGKSGKFYVCGFCGNVTEKMNFKECPICGRSKKIYIEVR
ncbi:MAG TPA: ferritin family protein [Candidatus Omnitrophota bacterium]|nr:ferritin family protein [Candidatus Omnitrophota bacterium]